MDPLILGNLKVIEEMGMAYWFTPWENIVAIL
jgi:hypothetical protein